MEKSSFFNSEIVNGEYDRVYLAEDYANYFCSFIGNGVFPNPSMGLEVTTDDESMTIQVNEGKAWINGYYYENTSKLVLNIEPADGVLDRIDRVVLRLDLVEREISVKIKKGDFSSTPSVKPLERNADIYELALADIKIMHGIISVKNSFINDVRLNKELCGIVHGVVDQVDTTEIFNTYQNYLNEKLNGNEFNEWFMELKNRLDPDSDIAASLQIQINGLERKVGTIEESVGENLKEQLSTKATKDGTLQENLNADMLDGKHLSDLASKVHNHDVLTGGNSNKLDLSAPNDWAGLEKPNNVNIDTWWGVSFSNRCQGQPVPVGGVGVSIDARQGKIMTKGDIICNGKLYVNGQDLFQNVSNGKSAIANAIAGKGISSNGNMTFEQLANCIRNISINSLGGKKVASGYFLATGTSYTIDIGFRGTTAMICIPQNMSYDQYPYLKFAMKDVTKQIGCLLTRRNSDSKLNGYEGYTFVDTNIVFGDSTVKFNTGNLGNSPDERRTYFYMVVE